MPGPHPTRLRRLLPLALATCGTLVVSGVAVSVLDEPVFRARASAVGPLGGTPVQVARVAAETTTGPPAPDGQVEIRDGWTPLSVPEEWSDVGPLLEDAVDDAADLGLDLTMCVQAIDAPGERFTCAGSGDELYAASVTKIAYAVAALEAWGDDPKAKTPYGVTVGDVVDDAITVSDNDAADLTVLLAAAGPDALDDDPFEAINTVTARVGLDEEFHSGNYYTVGYWSPDWSHLTAEGAMRYLTELVRAADDRAADGEPRLTSPRVARFVLDAMRRQERTDKIPRELPKGSTANKTGETETVSHDLAVVNTATGRYAMAAVSTAYGIFAGPEEIVAETAADIVEALGGGLRF